MGFIKVILFLFSILVLNSCANIATPGGGPKDIKPPFIVNSIPKNNSINYSGKKITIEFNERIIANTLSEDLIINPTIEGEFKSSIKKNILTIILEKNLKSNTTYTLNFREGIKDVTENNTSKNIQIAFSTGEQLDSVKIKGNIFDLLSNNTVPNALISLYASGDTSNATNSKPLYFSKTNKEGNYQISNIKAAKYDLYAFIDFNKNYLYDNENEKIFFQKNIQIDSSTVINLYLAKLKSADIKIQSKRIISGTETTININKGIEKAIIIGKNPNNLYLKTAENGRSINFYSAINIPDSIPLNLYLEDSLGISTTQTVYLGFKDQNKEKNLPIPAKINPIKRITPSDLEVESGNFNFIIEFEKPVTTRLINNIVLKKDSVQQPKNSFKATWDTNFTKLTLAINSPFKDSLILSIPKGTFISIQNDTNKLEKYIIRYKKEEEYSILDGSITTNENSYILQLIDSKFKVIQQLENPKIFNFNYILPGLYYLRIIVDKNRNHKWDAGSLIQNIQPEQIIFYKEKFNLRANWEITGIDFKF